MILCAGENLIDLLPDPPGADGALRLRAVPGGAPCNCARALARLGTPSAYLAPVSTDGFGQILAARLAADGVGLAGGRSDRPTALAVVTLTAAGPSYAFHRHATADRDITPAGLRAALPTGAQALCLSGMALSEGADAAAWADLAAEAPARGMILAVDPNIRPAALPADAAPFRARLARLCALADLVKLSEEDAAWIAPDQPPEATAAAYLAAGAGLVVLTRGAAGAVGLARSGRVARPAAPVTRLADTVGAGDVFLATLLDGLRRQGALAAAAIRALPADRLAALMDRAARAAALCCARPGCDPPHLRDLG